MNPGHKISDRSPAASSQENPAAGSTSDARLLIVEDEPLVALDLLRRLKGLGYTVVTTAGSGEDALAMAELHRPTLVLLDVRLAGQMDGIQVAEKLNRGLGTPVIFVTGNADKSTLDRAEAVHPYNVILKPIRDRELRISIEAALHHDRLRRELLAARESLEQRVRERTEELATANQLLRERITEHVKTEAKLRLSRASAEAAIHSRTRFFANISHEIRTPMNGIVGMAEVLSQTPLTSEQKDYIDTMKRCAATLLTTVNEVIVLSELESGHVDVTPRPVDLRSLLPSIFRPLAFQASAKQLELSCDVAPEVPSLVYVDPIRLEQILVHLIEFCFKAMNSGQVAGQVEVQFEVLSCTAERAHLHFTVRDNSAGLEPDELAKIDKFLDDPERSARNLEDLCFGLAIPGVLVPLLGGLLWLESVAGSGNTFHCSLWVEITEARARAQSGQAQTRDSFSG